jgi:RNA polymerase sigma-70 factor (ECF subfamily)
MAMLICGIRRCGARLLTFALPRVESGRMSIEARVNECLARGDAAGAATLAIQGYGPAIHGYLCSLLDPDDAADVFGAFAEQIWRSLPGFRWECSLRAWVYRLAWTAVAHFRRDPWRRRGEHLPSSAASRLAASIAQSGMEPGGRRDRLRQLRAEMPDEDQTLLVLRVDKELEWDEIAAVLAAESAPVSAATLRKRYERIKTRLARRAREEGLVN